jgi:hypothetical protein
MAGKGPSPDQCRASAVMEFVERYSFARNNAFLRESYDCYELKTGKLYKIRPILELRNTMCLAAGNNTEEAVLHCLHELVETRSPLNNLWKPCTWVDTSRMFPELPDWVHNTIALIHVPTERDVFSRFTAVQFPFNREFDNVRDINIQREGEKISFVPRPRDPKRHSPNSGGAAGLHPKKTAFRAMNEIFQFQNPVADYKSGRKKEPPDYIHKTDGDEFPNHETDSITDDIRKILGQFDEDIFIGVIDMTDPDIGIPVVKLISDYNPRYSFVSRETMNEFFDF